MNGASRRNVCLAVLLDQKPVVALVPWSETGNLRVGDHLFLDQQGGGFMGFHDWLRSAPGHVIGMRFSPHDPSILNRLDLERLNYVVVGPGASWLEVFLASDRDYDPHASADQSFRLSRLLFSSDRDAALVIDCDALTEAELATITPMPPNQVIHWET
jgi:hypothetical protein